MRLTTFFILASLFLSLQTMGIDHNSGNFFSSPDTIPAPPAEPSPLSGPETACVGEASAYTTDVPVACNCQWSVNGIIQTETGSPLVITWEQPGAKIVSVVFVCENGVMTDPVSVSTDVFQVPQPGPITGDELVCEYTFHTYSTTVNPGDSCQWTVNGAMQPGFGPSIEYSFGSTGTYLFEVIAFNPCGTSIPQTLEVTAQGSAPGTPSPVVGPDESCEGNTDTYSTTVNEGESCAWRIDGVLQPSSSATMLVTWTEWGEHLIEVRAVSDCGTGNPAYKNVSVFYGPEVWLGNDTSILQGQTLVLDAGNPGSDYLWSTGAVTQTITVGNTGSYRVNVSNYCGSDSDTITVSVIVGITEAEGSEGCFAVRINQQYINFVNLPEGVISIQLITISGKTCYEGPPVDRLNVSAPGIYLVRMITEQTSCYKKIFIP